MFDVSMDIIIILMVMVLLIGVSLYELGIIGNSKNSFKNETHRIGSILNNSIDVEQEMGNAEKINKQITMDVPQKCPGKVTRGMIFIDHATKLPCYTDYAMIGRGKNGTVYYGVVLTKNYITIQFVSGESVLEKTVNIDNSVFEYQTNGFVNITSFGITEYYIQFWKVKLFAHADTTNTIFIYYVLLRNYGDSKTVVVNVCPKSFFTECITAAEEIINEVR